MPRRALPIAASEGATDPDLEKYWDDLPRALVKSEMKRQNLTYEELAFLLGQLGIKESAANLRNKINRGNFGATFFMQCISCLRCDLIQVGPNWHLTSSRKSSF